MPKINILILAAGHNGDLSTQGGYPLCLTETQGVSLLEHLVRNTEGLNVGSFTYAMLDEEVRKFRLDSVVELLTPGARIVKIQKGTKGSGCTALLAAATLPADEELLVLSANELVDLKLVDVVKVFRQRNLDAGTLTFNSIHPRYSYVKLSEEGDVIEAAQQNPISRNATTGVFWFKTAGAFVESCKSMIRKGAMVNDAYYVAPAFNEMLLNQARIGVSPIHPASYMPLKTERQVEVFETSHMSTSNAIVAAA